AEIAPHRRRMFHGTVKVGSKHETKTDFSYVVCYLPRCLIKVDPERFKYIRTPRLAGYRAPTMLGNPRPGSSGDKRCGGGNVESMSSISTSPACVYKVLVIHDFHSDGKFSHYLCGSCDFADGFFLYP